MTFIICETGEMRYPHKESIQHESREMCDSSRERNQQEKNQHARGEMTHSSKEGKNYSFPYTSPLYFPLLDAQVMKKNKLLYIEACKPGTLQ